VSLTRRYRTKSVNEMCYSSQHVSHMRLSRTRLQPGFTGQTPVAHSVIGIDSRRTDLPTGSHRSLSSRFYRASASAVRTCSFNVLFFPSFFLFHSSLSSRIFIYTTHRLSVNVIFRFFIASFSVHLSSFHALFISFCIFSALSPSLLLLLSLYSSAFPSCF
jgi:hypothetical protein